LGLVGILARFVQDLLSWSNLHSDTTILQPNRTNTPVNTGTEQYTYIQSPGPKDECNNIRNMLTNKKLSSSDIKLVQFIQLDFPRLRKNYRKYSDIYEKHTINDTESERLKKE
jgi:hypothetical protein